MNQKQIVVLFGDSLFLDTVEAGLGTDLEIGLVRIYTSVTDVVKRLQSFHPDFVIFDIVNLDDHTLLSLLKDQPGTLFLGLDINTNRIIALCCQCHTAHSLADLTQIIRQRSLNGLQDEPFPPDLRLEQLETP